jgi:hypothetical protein
MCRAASGFRLVFLTLAVLFGSGAVRGIGSRPALADSGRDSTANTGYYVYVGQSAASVTTTINGGFRPVCLKVASGGAAPTFDTTFVANTGPYAQGFWWYYNATITDVTTLLNTNNARLISVESYDAGGGSRRFAVVMVSNTGANAKTWYWYAGSTVANISAAANAANARVIYLSSDVIGGTRVYNAILISNTGADANSWYWYTGASTSFISSLLSTNNQRIISLEVADPAGPTFNVVTEGSHGQRWWWFYNFTTPQAVLDQAGQYGARVFDVQRYTVGTSTRYAALYLDNVNPLTERIGDILRSGTDGVSGCYLKQMNGPVLAGLQQDYVFEPASMIKTLYHLHTLLKIQTGPTPALNTLHTVYGGYSGSCPLDTLPGSETMQTSLNLMMVNSDNARAQSIRAYFGQAAITATGTAIGMTNSLVNNRMGCGLDPAGDVGAVSHPNQLTLSDLGTLYEHVTNNVLNATYKPLFYSLMDHSIHTDLDAILTQEAAAQGISGAKLASFRSNISIVYKGGSYGLSASGNAPFYYHQTRGGWIKIPHRTAGCTTTYFEYAYSTFVNFASNDTNASNAAQTAFAELPREQLRAALATYACPADFNASGGLEVQDIFDFLNAWLAGQPCADFNGTGGLQVQDIFDFLNAWLAGC